MAVEGRYDTCAFADIDHDGAEDLYVNGTVTGGTSYPDYLFRNNGAAFEKDAKFEDVTPANLRALQADHGAAWADVDNDGDLDLALTGTRADGMHLVLRSMMMAAERERGRCRFASLSADGRATTAGAEVRVYENRERQLIAARIVDSGSGYNAQNDLPVHVGTLDRLVDVEVTLPRKGRPVTRATRINPRDYSGRALVIRAR